MTIEEKARAYDKALSKAREYHFQGQAPDKLAELESIFPQLRESENERIRKELIQFLTDVRNISESGRTSWAVREEDVEMCNGFIAYLEKQKENPKSAEEVLAKAGLKPYKDGNQWCILAGDNIQEGICGFGDTIEDALYQFLMEVLEKQKELNHDGKKWIYQNDYNKVLRSWYMEGYQDREHNQEPKWIVKTGEGGPRYEENPKYGQPLVKEQKLIEDVVEDITKNKESATKFLKSAGIMDDNGELAEMYRSGQKPADDKVFEEWIDGWWKDNKVNSQDSYYNCDEIQFNEREFKNFCRGIRNMYQQKPEHYSPLCNTIKDKIREYIANHFVSDTVVKTDVKSIVKAMEESIRLGIEEYCSAEWSEEDKKILHAIEFHVGQLDSSETINGFSSSDMLRVLKSIMNKKTI